MSLCASVSFEEQQMEFCYIKGQYQDLSQRKSRILQAKA